MTLIFLVKSPWKRRKRNHFCACFSFLETFDSVLGNTFKDTILILEASNIAPLWSTLFHLAEYHISKLVEQNVFQRREVFSSHLHPTTVASLYNLPLIKNRNKIMKPERKVSLIKWRPNLYLVFSNDERALRKDIWFLFIQKLHSFHDPFWKAQFFFHPSFAYGLPGVFRSSLSKVWSFWALKWQ